jgi:RND superfamily putative drug exporter
MKHPVVAIVASVTLLLAAAAPFLTLQLGSMGLRDFPRDMETVQAFLILDEDFSAGRLSPAEVTFKGDVDSPVVQDGVRNLEIMLNGDDRFANLSELEMNNDGTIGALSVEVDGDSFGPDARAAVEDLRNDYLPAAFGDARVDIAVTGGAASTTDYVDTMNRYLPIVVGFVLLLSFVLLMMVFRSLVIPVKAIIMNLLSVGAAYGLIVLVFQHGVGADLLGFNQADSIEAFLPIFMFAVLFGLSMDYHVFLLSRIQERFLQTGDNAAAVAYGLRSTAHIITGAALIMIMVFAGFAMGDMTALQQTGFGLAVAVFIDATIVRTVLVPASMQMLGEWNWYLPSWLQWLPKIHVEGDEAPASPALRPTLATSAGGD